MTTPTSCVCFSYVGTNITIILHKWLLWSFSIILDISIVMGVLSKNSHLVLDFFFSNVNSNYTKWFHYILNEFIGCNECHLVEM
jgi:hypothetical protein